MKDHFMGDCWSDLDIVYFTTPKCPVSDANHGDGSSVQFDFRAVISRPPHACGQCMANPPGRSGSTLHSLMRDKLPFTVAQNRRSIQQGNQALIRETLDPA